MTRRILLAVTLTLASAGACHAGAGLFNLPSRVMQWWGYGCGPGYHANMTLRPHAAAGPNHHTILRERPTHATPAPYIEWAPEHPVTGVPRRLPPPPEALPTPAE